MPYAIRRKPHATRHMPCATCMSRATLRTSTTRRSRASRPWPPSLASPPPSWTRSCRAPTPSRGRAALELGLPQRSRADHVADGGCEAWVVYARARQPPALPHGFRGLLDLSGETLRREIVPRLRSYGPGYRYQHLRPS